MMKMLFIAWTELRRQLNSPWRIVVSFLTPLLLIFILGSSLSGMGFGDAKDVKLSPIQVGVVREDRGQLMAAFDAFMQAPAVQGIASQMDQADRISLESNIRNGIVDFGVVIPADFSERVMRGEGSKWEFVLGGDAAKNTMGESLFRSFLDTANANQAVAFVLGESTAQNFRLASIEGAENGSFMTAAKLSKTEGNYSALQYYSVSILVMFILYSGMSAALSFLSDRSNHTLPRMMSQPLASQTIVLGKIIGNIAVAICQAVVIIAVTKWIYGVNWGNRWGMLAAVIILLTACAMALSIVLLARARSVKGLQSTFMILIIAMTALSGGFVPLTGIESISAFTISYWGMQGMLRIMLDSGTDVIVHIVGVLAAIGAALTAVSLIAYRRVIANE